jgi:hypothetical protein
MFLATSPFSPHLSHTPTLNLLPPVVLRYPRPPAFSPVPSEAGISPPHLSHRPTKSNRTGYKVFVNRSLSSQNMCARASKWLEKNLHLLEIRLRLLVSKGSIFFATLAHTAATLSSCAPAHSLSLRLVLIAAWLLVLLHNARSILTRGYSCPLKPQ